MRLEKILYLSDILKVDSSTLRTFDLARALTARGIEVETIASGGTFFEKFRQAGLPLRFHYKIHRTTLPFICNTRIISVARSIKPVIIHARCPRLSRLASRLARACRTNYVVTVNSIAESSCTIKRGRRLAGIIAASEHIREYLVNDKGIPKDIISVIPNGVDIDPFRCSMAFEEEAEAKEGEERTPVIGMIGRFASGEGHDCFLAAAKIILEQLPKAQFVIAGDGKDRYVRDKVEKLKLSHNVTIVPAFMDYKQLLSSFDVLLVPAESEGRARLILESMACRRPVIATGVGENYEVIRDGETGYLVQKNDAEAFARRTLEMLTDHELRQGILDTAFDSVEKSFSLARMAKNSIAFYTKILEA